MTHAVPDAIVREVRIPADHGSLTGDLAAPPRAGALVLFAHGSGSSRKSPRNTWVAGELQRAGVATLLFDLLTRAEEARDIHTREHRFDIPLLARRLVQATAWVDTQPDLRALPLGYFGACTGSAAALVAAHELGARVGAVVSRGGRPDLAGAQALAGVTAATLLIVGGHDETVLELNERALRAMTCQKSLVVVPGATHLFEEPGTLEQVAALASRWFVEQLVANQARG
jgi:predicted alpha/beta-hydrolase family hydrolase